ncbi:hypothetical protein ACYF6T_14105 [Streptomyces sp. 7R007]
MLPLVLMGAAVLGACMVFGYSQVLVGLVLMVVGVFGLMMFLSTPGTVRRPGETGTVIEERHYMGDSGERMRHR